MKIQYASAALALFLVVPRFALAAATEGAVTCKDGTTANAGRGACHGHGGVDKSAAAGTEATKSTSAPTAAESTVTCKDGTTGPGGRGACHGHGGVDKSATAGTKAAKSASAPAAAAPAAVAAPKQANDTASEAKPHAGKAATADAAGALAKCKDGMYWHGTKHSGACSHHGGVAEWLDGSKN